MALLTDSPRTATVVAETDLTVWRLTRPRFEALLDHERGIARSIERSLSLRLAAMNLETGALRAFSHRLTAAALGRLSPPGGPRCSPASPRDPGGPPRRSAGPAPAPGTRARSPSWSSSPRLLRADGSDLVVDPTFLALAGPEVREPNPAWLRAASEEMAAGRRRRRGHGPRAGGRSGRGRRAAARRPRDPPAPDRVRRRPRPLAGDGERALSDSRGAARRPADAAQRAAGDPGGGGGPGQPRARDAPPRVGSRASSRPCARWPPSRRSRSSGWGGSCPCRKGWGAAACHPRRHHRDRAAARRERAARLRRHAVPDSGPCRARPRVARGHPRRLRRSRLAHDLHAARGGRRGGPLGAHVPAGAAVAPATAAAVRPPERGALPDRAS